ncbi:hypothetical protein, partial [Neptunicoccus cionae]|uniref:hypothetical protein n=1 Tax=Neptunicoccus cionae TaxID=2035344 RepID=UPI000CBAEA96
MYRLLFANNFWHVLGSRSYVFGLLIDTRAVALLGLRTRRDLISGQVDYDHLGRQTLGGVIFPFHALLSIANSELPPEIRTVTQATICSLLIFDEKEIRDVET